VTFHFLGPLALKETDYVGIEGGGRDLLMEEIMVYSVERLRCVKDDHSHATRRLCFIEADGYICNYWEECRHRAMIGPIAMLSRRARKGIGKIREEEALQDLHHREQKGCWTIAFTVLGGFPGFWNRNDDSLFPDRRDIIICYRDVEKLRQIYKAFGA
jgi:hypothetical protein